MLKFVCLILSTLSVGIASSQSLVTITPSEAKQIMDTTQIAKITIIDARDSAMFASGQIKGAINIDAFSEQATRLILPYLNTDSIMIYCTHTKRSDVLAEIFIKSGFGGHLSKISDGISGWREQGYLLEN